MRSGLGVMLAALLLFTMSAGCARRDAGTSADSSGASSGGSSGGSNTADAEDMDVDFSGRDMDVGYSEAESTLITLGAGGIAITGGGAAAVDSTVTITGAGTYVLSGVLENGRIIVNAGKEDKIQLVFRGVSVHCQEHNAIHSAGG